MNTPTRRFLFLLSSTRRMGNCEQLAYCAAHSLPPDAEQQWLHLMDYPLPYFVDLRHHGTFPTPTGNIQVLLDATLAATDIVLVAPLYMFSLPALGKHYLDYWNAWLRIPSLNFREQMQGKTLWAIIVNSGDQPQAQPLEATLRLTAQFMRMPWGGMLRGTGSRPNDIQMDLPALQRAKSFFHAAPATEAKPPLPVLSKTAAAPLE